MGLYSKLYNLILYQKIHICIYILHIYLYIYILDPGFNQHLMHYNNVKSLSSLLSPIDSFFFNNIKFIKGV